MKLIIDIPEKTNAHIRSDYGHGVVGLRYDDEGILCHAVYHGTPYEERPHGEWKYEAYGQYLSTYKCSNCGFHGDKQWICCPYCGADMRKEGEAE